MPGTPAGVQLPALDQLLEAAPDQVYVPAQSNPAEIARATMVKQNVKRRRNLEIGFRDARTLQRCRGAVMGVMTFGFLVRRLFDSCPRYWFL
jgi:hypothetical protein